MCSTFKSFDWVDEIFAVLSVASVAVGTVADVGSRQICSAIWSIEKFLSCVYYISGTVILW